MKKLLLSLTMVLLTATGGKAADTPASFADLVEKLSPAVVNISTTQLVKNPPVQQQQVPPGAAPQQPAQPGQPPLQNSPFQPFNQFFGGGAQPQTPAQPRKATSLGSGFIISPTGIVVTNNHVVASGTDITVTLHDDTKLKAKIIGRDEKVDVAVLKIDAGKSLPYVKFGNSDIMRVGDWVLAIGNPYGLGGTVTAGIISARARDINVGPFDDFLQTDAAINRGNSGGPMFNISGDVVGINTAIFSPTGGNVGIGFATPSSLVRPVIEQIVKYGKAKRAWLGVKIQTVTDEIAASIGLKQTGGALVLEVIPNSPAAKAGVHEGDVITKFANSQVAAMRKLPRIVADTELGSDVPMEIYRNGKTQTLTVVLTEMTAEQEKSESRTQGTLGGKTTAITGKILLGMKVAEITPALKNQYKLAHNRGLLIAEVATNSNAAEQGIRGGNVITKANQRPIRSIADFSAAIAEARKQGRDAILLLIEAGNGSEERFVPVKLK